VAAALLFCKTKTPPPGLAMGFVKLVNKLEPNRRAAQQQRVQQQVQIQIVIHAVNLSAFRRESQTFSCKLTLPVFKGKFSG
jgi:hypothetical protein